MSIFDKIRLLLQFNQLWNEMEDAMIVNWRTTLTGVFGALAVGLTGYLETHGITMKDVLQVIVLSALGYFAKDAGVTGGAK